MIAKIQLIQACFESNYFQELFSGEGTHDPALRVVGQIVRHTDDDNLILAIVKSGLPENYEDLETGGEKNTLSEIPGMIRDARAKGFEKFEIGIGKKSAEEAEVLLALVQNQQGLEYFHGAYHRPYISTREEGKGAITLRLNSEIAKMWLKGVYYRATQEAISAYQFNAAVETMQAIALFSSPYRKVFLRVAATQDNVVINLADVDGRVIIIDAEGYKITTTSPATFVNSPMMKALPAPDKSSGDVLKELQVLWGVNDETFILLLIFLIGCLNPRGPYLCLLIEGEQGSGKSFLCSMLKDLIDPSEAPKLRFPKDDRDLMIAAQDSYLLVFDNISGVRADMSDALCSLSTGGGFATRMLYTNDEQQVFNESRPYILNGIAEYATRPDLVERAVSINLPSMPEGQRKPEEEIKDRFDELRPRVLDKLYEIVACALKMWPSVKAPTTVRMADAAKWILAAEPLTGYPEGTLIRALEKNQHESMAERMDNDPVASALAVFLRKQAFHGAVSDLFRVLQAEVVVIEDRSFPKTAQHLSKKLKVLRPAMKKMGIHMDFPTRSKDGQKVSIWMEGYGCLETAKRMASMKGEEKRF